MHNSTRIIGTSAGIFAGLCFCVWLGPHLLPDGMPPPALPEQQSTPAPSPSGAPSDQATPRLPSVKARQEKTLTASFEEVEQVSAQAELKESEKSAVQKFAFPPLAFHWAGRPEDLAPAFIWESPNEGFHLGNKRVPDSPEGDALLEHYSASLAIRMPGTSAVLRMHYNVIARLRTWVEEIRPELKTQQLRISVECQTPNEVTLRMPAVGAKPARTIIVGI